jgi:hypothetical protein
MFTHPEILEPETRQDKGPNITAQDILNPAPPLLYKYGRDAALSFAVKKPLTLNPKS